MSNISNRITALREQRGWSKTYVAKKLGLNLSTYANYEYGNREPDIKTLTQIANAYGVSTDYLLKGEGSNTSAKDLEDAIDEAMSFEGLPVTEHDKKVMKRLWKAYLESKD